VEINSFHANTQEMTNCDPRNPQDRMKRIEFLNSFFEQVDDWLIDGISSQMLNQARLSLLMLPSVWLRFYLSKGGPGIPVTASRNDIAQDTYITAIDPVEESVLRQLEELFSLNHIADLDAETDGENDPDPLPNPHAPLVPEPGQGIEAETELILRESRQNASGVIHILTEREA